jgi:hypothetical protein
MRNVRKLVAIGGASALLVLSSVTTAAAHGGGKGGDHHDSVKVLLGELSSPKGLGVTAEKDLVVAQGAFGAPGPVLVFDLQGPDRGTVTPVTDPVGLVDVAISPLDGTGWGIGAVDDTGEVHLLHQLADGTIVDVLNVATYQATDPDPVDRDDPPNPTESNAYGLTIMDNGDALVADAAGNDVIRVTPDGVATTVARLDVEPVATDHLPPDFGPLPPELEAEAVPTTVTIGPDGAIYVGELKGFPFRPGTSHVWRIEPDADGAWCSVDEPDPTGMCSLYSSGYTGIEDIAFNHHNGRLYVYEFAAEGVLAFEAALDPTSGVPFPPAVLLEVKHGKWGEKRTELAAGQLSQPGGVEVVRGKVYVTDGVFTSGRLVEVKRQGW